MKTSQVHIEEAKIVSGASGPIGVFDSGYGGLTILHELRDALPQHDFMYLGDNARAPYGSRSFESIYHYTLEAVNHLFSIGCPLIILACNTASARALRTIQQKDLPGLAPENRVLGVLRPAIEQIGHYSKTGEAGILATEGTVRSESYLIEGKKFFPKLNITQKACPMLVPLVENHETDNEGAHYFVKRYVDELMQEKPNIDSVLLACTHFPVLLPLFKEYFPEQVQVVSQGKLVSASLVDYLKRHPEMEQRLTKNSELELFTTEQAPIFDRHAGFFYDGLPGAKTIEL